MAFKPFHTEQHLRDGLPPGAPKALRILVEQGADGRLLLAGHWKGPPWHGPTSFPIATKAGDTPELHAPICLVGDVQWDSTTLLGTAALQVPEVTALWRGADAGKAGVIVIYLTGVNFLAFGTNPVDLQGMSFAWQLRLLEPTMETRQRLTGDPGAVTATLVVTVSDVSASIDAEVQEAREIARLLGFAAGAQVSVARVDLIDEDGWQIKTQAWDTPPASVALTGPLPLDDLNLRGGVVPYLQRALAAMRSKDHDYRLRTAMHINTLARASHVREVTALLSVNLLEVVRHNYGMNVLIPAGRARLSGNDICWPVGTNGGRRMHFAEIITELCTDLALVGWEAAFKDLRNSIVHQGDVSGSTGQEKWDNTAALLHFTDRLLLALLDVGGAGISYFRVTNGDFVPFDPSTP